MSRTLTALTMLISASLATPAAALQAEQRVLKETVVTQADGTQKTKYVPAELVTPGETVVYALVFNNEQSQPAEDIVLVMPIPNEITYIENSANNRLATAEYSADGGTSFAPRNSLTVREVDGSNRPASAEDLTHIRWSITSAIAPGETGQLWFRGVLK